MGRHLGGYRRAWFVVVLFVGLGTCVSCGSDPQSETFLEEHSQELIGMTIPVNATGTVRSSVQRTTWAEKASWEFDTKMSRAEYTDWVKGKLKSGFRVASSTDSRLSFSKDLDNDTESITVQFAPTEDHLHVRVEAVVSPD